MWWTFFTWLILSVDLIQIYSSAKHEALATPFCPDIFPSKSGACPQLPVWTPCDCHLGNIWCKKDIDCPGRQKCCSYGCGCRSMCIIPDKIPKQIEYIVEVADLSCILPYPPHLISPCQLPKLPGPCIAAIPRWWYSATSGRCVVFRYGGCCGNANNFLSQEDCEMQCVGGNF